MEKNYVEFSYPLTITNFEEWVHIISYLKGPNIQTVNQICSVDFIFFGQISIFQELSLDFDLLLDRTQMQRTLGTALNSRQV